MRRDAGYPETRALFHRDVLREKSDVIQRDHREFRGGTERAVRLCSVTPHAPTDPFRGNVVTDTIDLASTIAVRDHAWIRHAVAESVLPLLNVAGVNARGGDANADFAGARCWIGHIADVQNFPCWSLLLIPSCLHLLLPSNRNVFWKSCLKAALDTPDEITAGFEG
jgi:hypothetical protein